MHNVENRDYVDAKLNDLVYHSYTYGRLVHVTTQPHPSYQRRPPPSRLLKPDHLVKEELCSTEILASMGSLLSRACRSNSIPKMTRGLDTQTEGYIVPPRIFIHEGKRYAPISSVVPENSRGRVTTLLRPQDREISMLELLQNKNFSSLGVRRPRSIPLLNGDMKVDGFGTFAMPLREIGTVTVDLRNESTLLDENFKPFVDFFPSPEYTIDSADPETVRASLYFALDQVDDSFWFLFEKMPKTLKGVAI